MQSVDFLEKIERSRANCEKFCASIRLPRMRRVQQLFPRDEVTDIAGTVRAELEASGMKNAIKKGGRIAVCAGSRGLAHLPILVKATVDWVRAAGGDPFVMPAMGSHGGATAEGQADMLNTLGVNEKSVGAPIISHMETRIIGEAMPGFPLHMSVDILDSDGCIFVCRVKPHTSYRGKYESGFMKMLAIGAGKHNGALVTHHQGFGVFHEMIPKMGQCALERAPIIGGVGSIENAFYKIAKIKALRADQFMADEPALLQEAFTFMGQIYLNDLDVLMVDEIGKNFSGDGMDPNITGSFSSPHGTGGIKAESRIVFALSEETHGNATGLGPADFTTPKVFREFDPVTTYTNAMTAHIPIAGKMPLVMPDEYTAFRMGIHNSIRAGGQSAPRVVHIDNTEQVEFINISEALWIEAEAHERITFVTEPFDYQFDNKGEIVRGWKQ
jgi:hypothetical protein